MSSGQEPKGYDPERTLANVASVATLRPEEPDPFQELVVDWKGPDDPQNPKNWSYGRKWVVTAIVSAFTFISPVSSSMIAPAMTNVAKEFGITNPVVLACTISVFVLAYAFGPLFLGPLSEILGRSTILQVSNVWFFAWNLGCGFAQNMNQLIAFRFLAGLGGSAPLSIGGAVLGDIWKPEERGKALALFSLAPLLGPVVGPLTGAWVAEKMGWRWVFYATSIADAVVQIGGLLFLRETFAPVLLERKAADIKKMLSDAEKGKKVRTVFEGENRRWQTIMAKALLRPFALFAYEPIMQLLGIYMAFVYGLLYLFLTTLPSTFEGVYNESTGIAGLNYIALGIGLTGASQISGRLLDRVYVYFKNKNGDNGRPEYRLPPMMFGTVFLPIGLFLTGWTTEARVHWIVPDIGIVFVGAGIGLAFQGIQTYVIDAFTVYAASALAAITFLRSLAGFCFPLFAPAMYKALGFGKGDTILAIFAIVVGCPAPWLFWIYGERIRKASRHAKKP